MFFGYRQTTHLIELSKRDRKRGMRHVRYKGMVTKMTELVYMPEGYLLKSEQNTYYTSDIHHLERAKNLGLTLEGTATKCDSGSMDLTVEVGSFRGIIPRDEAVWSRDGSEVRDIAIITRVGKPTSFKIRDIKICEDGEPLLLLSRKEAQIECECEYISKLRPGDIIHGTVTHLEPFGAFVDIGCGIISLLTIDAISVSRISHPKDRFKCGDNISCVVRSIDRDSRRIFLSCRELLGTWEENVSAFSPSQTVTGIVRSIESYGIFIELAPNLAGLAEYRDGVEVGDICAVYIKSIIPERMKIKLILINNAKGDFEHKLKYYVDTDTADHIPYWRYSPEGSVKLIESVFDK